MKKYFQKFTLAMVVVLLIGTIAGCSKTPTVDPQKDTTSSSNSTENKKNELVIMNSKMYVSDFPFAAEEFGKKNNCDVKHVYGGGSMGEYMMTIMSGGRGEVDVVNINPIYVQQFLSEGLLEPIDTSQLENYGDIMPMFRDHKAFQDADGNIFAVPWVWGSTALAYNSDEIDKDITSWKQMWSGEFAGKIGYYDEYFSAIVTASLYLGEDPANPDMDKVREALLDMHKQAKTYWGSYDDWFKAFKSREITIGNVWTGGVTPLQEEGEPIVYVYPDEGAIGWADSWVILKDAPNPEMAIEWINYATSEYFQYQMAIYPEQKNTPTNTKVLEALTDDEKKSLLIYPEIPDNLFLQYQDSEQEKEWVDFWNSIKASP